ncbi:Uncharacterised protein [Mycobacteroides abscessus subsp. abscessus]|nr:Uncharacterised protein [Mycobacteroides abscessus subsp. abscessus]
MPRHIVGKQRYLNRRLTVIDQSLIHFRERKGLVGEFTAGIEQCLALPLHIIGAGSILGRHIDLRRRLIHHGLGLLDAVLGLVDQIELLLHGIC